MIIYQPIMLEKFGGGPLKSIIRSYAIKRDIVIRIDVFTGKERICWDCGGTRTIVVIFNVIGYSLEFDEECVGKDSKLPFWFLRTRYKIIKLLFKKDWGWH